MTPYSQSFTLDTTGPSVVALSPNAEPGAVQFSFDFSEALDPGWLGTGALLLHEQLSNQNFNPNSWNYDSTNHRVTFYFNSLSRSGR